MSHNIFSGFVFNLWVLHMHILASFRFGEIDIIGYDREYLIFFEVKYRQGDSMGSAVEAVEYRKQQKICRVSDYYRMIHHCPTDTPVRFDVIAIDGDSIRWIRNAFDYCGRA